MGVITKKPRLGGLVVAEADSEAGSYLAVTAQI